MATGTENARPVGTIWTHDLREPAADVTPLVDASFRQVTRDEAGPVDAVMPAGSAGRRFAAGGRCYTAWVNDQLAAYGWVSFNEEYVGELQMTIRLTQDEVYIWDCVTLPAFRQKGLYSALLVYILNELRAEPLRRAWIGADLDNEPSQRGIDRAGFRRVADLLIARQGTQRLFTARAYPGVPEGLVAEARRVFMGGKMELRLPDG